MQWQPDGHGNSRLMLALGIVGPQRKADYVLHLVRVCVRLCVRQCVSLLPPNLRTHSLDSKSEPLPNISHKRPF